MGACLSNKIQSDPFDDLNIDVHLSKFITTQCVLDPAGYMMFSDFIAMFYTYLFNQRYITLNSMSIFKLSHHIFRRIKMEFLNYPVEVRLEGVVVHLNDGRIYYDYTYIHGLKLARSLHSA